tara:strand:- start:301 stop:414 length:114 start_codon:yes stop_codon:yes gene_type:complete
MGNYNEITVNLERLKRDLEEVFSLSNNTNNNEDEKRV